MAATDATDNPNRSDYTSGDVRPHHEFYYDHGDIVIQVEKAVFKVHRNFLARLSTVLEDLFKVPQNQESADGTAQKPLILNGDTVHGWEALFASIYPSILLEPVQHNSVQLTALLRISHKYCMQSIEDRILTKLKATDSTAGYVDLMVASQIIGSQELHQEALQGLVSSNPKPNLEEAKKIGIEAYHELMQAPITSGSRWLRRDSEDGYAAADNSWGMAANKAFKLIPIHTMPRKPKATIAVNTLADYSTGTPRHHHSFYIEDGNFVIQVESAIFKIHRYFLARYSTVLRDMLDTPQNNQTKDGTDEKPLILTDDTASSWEHLLEAIYNSHSLEDSNSPSGELMLSILPIAHKYCMETIEMSILNRLKQASTTAAYVDLMVASRMVDSEPLYQQALTGLVSSHHKPDLAQATRIGVGPYHAVMTAAGQANANALTACQKVVAEGKEALEATKAELVAVKKQLSATKVQLSQLNNAAIAAGVRYRPY